MKRYSFLFALLFTLSGGALAQADTTALYLRFPSVPPFSILRVPDSTRFTKNDLSGKKKTLIMIFSPDCEHCQNMTRELIAHIGLFKKAQIVMASPLEFSYIRKFYEEYGIANYPVITMGRDPGYYLGSFYKVRSFPKIFLYDKKGNFVMSFEGEVPIEKIAENL